MIKTVMYVMQDYRLVEEREDNSRYCKKTLFWERHDGKDRMGVDRWIDTTPGDLEKIAKTLAGIIADGDLVKKGS